MHWKQSLAAFAVLGFAAPALAHPGPRVWIGSDSAGLATFTSDNDLNPTTFSQSRVFIAGVDEDTETSNGRLDEVVPGSGVFSSSFPGYQVRTDGAGGLATGSSVGFRIAGPLLAFDAANHAFKTTSALYGANAPQIGVSSGANLAKTSDGPVNGFSFFTYNSAGDHAHLAMTLYGDGANPVDGPHAVYALPLQLTGAGLADSQPYYILLGRDIGSSDAVFQDALSTATSTLVPEPAMGMVAMVGLALTFRRSRRQA